MGNYYSFGKWIQDRRNRLRLSRSALAQQVGCSPETIKKIERDERRPSLQLAELLAKHLQLEKKSKGDFLRWARGEFVPQMASPTQLNVEWHLNRFAPKQEDLSNRFVIERLIGEGGHGQVFKGHDTKTGIPVVLKRLRPNLQTQPDLIARFLRESEALHQLQHPNIVKMLAVFERDKQHHIVLEYVANGSLRDLLTHSGPLEQQRCLDIVLELSDALSRAHHLSILHRDIKPANVLLAEDGSPLLADFGVARLLDNQVQITPTNGFVGSPAYASPETFLGEALDVRADIWSLGILMYELLTGKRPFDDERLSVIINQIINDPLPSIEEANLNPALAALLGQMLSKEPDKRPSSMRQIGATLEAIREGSPLPGVVKVESLPPKTPRPIDLTTLNDQTRLQQIPTDSVPPIMPLPTGSYLPYPPNPHFTGRQADLQALAKRLRGVGTATAITQVAATGMGGIGKSQLAIAFAHRYGCYFAGGVYWLSAADPKALSAEVARLGSEGHMQLYRDAASLSLPEQVAAVRRAWQEETPRLLIFDNVDSKASLTAVQKLLPTSGGCRLLLTSRRGAWAKSSGVKPLRLGMLPQADSIALLREHLPDADEKILAEIASELGHLPLALHLAGSFMDTYGHYEFGKPQAYLGALRKDSLLEHASLIGRGVEDSPTRHDLHLARTFALSLSQLDEHKKADALAKRILAVLACLAPGEPVPAWLWQKSALKNNDPFLLAEAEQRLLASGLIERGKEQEIGQHRLVVAFVRQELSDQVKAVFNQVVEVVNHQAEIENKAGYPQATLVWQPHLLEVTATAQRMHHRQSALLLTNLGAHLQTNGDYVAARPYYEQALSIREAHLGSKHPQTARTLNDLGELMKEIGDFSQAKAYLERALIIRERSLGNNHPETAASLNAIGDLQKELSNVPEAKPYYERALSIREAVLGLDHPETADTLHALGTLFIYLGEMSKSKELLERALAIREAIYGSEHPKTAASLSSLGYLLSDYPVTSTRIARAHLERALTIQEKVLHANHPDIANTLSYLGVLLRTQAEFSKAKELLERALTIREHALGSNHPFTLETRHEIGMVLLKMGSLDAAKAWQEQVLSAREEVLGLEHPQTSVSLNALGLIFFQLGDLVSTEFYFRRALSILENVFGERHHLTAMALNHYAKVLQRMDKLAAAKTFFERSLAILEDMYHPDYQLTQRVREGLEALLQQISQGD